MAAIIWTDVQNQLAQDQGCGQSSAVPITSSTGAVSPAEQAAWFIRNVPKDPDALPPVIDVEYNHLSDCKRRLSPEKIREKMQVFMDILEKHYGKRPIIYTAPDFYADNLRGAFPNHPFWLRAVAQHPSQVYPDRRWLFLAVFRFRPFAGVDGKIDLNVFSGSEADWHRWSGSRG